MRKSLTCFRNRFLMVALAVATILSRAEAQCQLQKITRANLYAANASLSDSLAVFSYAAGGVTPDGKVFIYQRTGTRWQWQQTISQVGDDFGISSTIAGGDILVGLPGYDSGGLFTIGAVRVYRESSGVWSAAQFITAPDATQTGYFGGSVAADGDVVVIGAWGADGSVSDSGAVYVYRRNGTLWTFEQKIEAENPQSDVVFGWNVAVKGDVIAVGASYDEGGAGAVYLFRYGGSAWSQEQRIVVPDPHSNELVGRAIALSDDRLVVGKPYDNLSPYNGRAFVYRFLGASWSLEQELFAADVSPGDAFGSAVAMDGDLIMIGAEYDDDASPGDLFCQSGSAYIFRFIGSQWVEQAKLVPTDTACSDVLGGAYYRTAAITREFAISGTNKPAVYVWGIAGDCNENTIIDVCEIDDGSVADTNDDLIPDICCSTDAECSDDNPCTADSCSPGVSCTLTPTIRLYGDVAPPGGDQLIELADILCELAGYSDEAQCVDGGIAPCSGDGLIELGDILASLNAYSGVYQCPHPCPP